MSINLTPTQLFFSPAQAATAVLSQCAAKHKGTKTNPLQQLMENNPLLRNHPKLAQDAMRLMDLKKRLQRTRSGSGPKRGRRGRRRRLQRRFRHLARRFMKNLRHVLGNHCQTGKTQQASSSSGKNYGFLNDPNLSLSEKIEMFLQKTIQDSEEKIEELMKKHADQGKKKPKAGDMFKKIGSVVAGLVGGPAAAMAVSAFGNAATSATDSTKGSSESEQQMTMFKIQKLQSHVQQMLSLFSTLFKKDNDLKHTLIRNMA